MIENKKIEYEALNKDDLCRILGQYPQMTDGLRASGEYHKVFKGYKCEEPGCGRKFYNGGVLIVNRENNTEKIIGWDCMDSKDGGKLRATNNNHGINQSSKSLKIIYSEIFRN